MTVGDLVLEIQKYCSWFKPNKTLEKKASDNVADINNTVLRLLDKIPGICETYQSFLANKEMSLKICNENLNRVVLEEGMTLEALGYCWIKNTSMGAFMRPIVKTRKTISGNDIDLDGEIDGEFLFDIKSFTPFTQSIQHKLSVLQKKHPQYAFMVTNRTDISSKKLCDASVYAQAKNIDENNADGGILHLPNSGMIMMKKRERVNLSESAFSPFAWCESNYKLFLDHCHQFVLDKPFVLVEMMDSDSFFDNSLISTYMLLRTLVRRTFFDLSENTDKAMLFDRKIADENILVKQAISFLSAIMFIDCRTGRAYAFINPKAKNNVNRQPFEWYSWENRITIDDFYFDNY